MRLLPPTACLLVLATTAQAGNWYTESFWLLHEDHHTSGVHEVGRDADLEETRRLVGLVKPDMIQIHAKGNPGWTTYPTKIGHTPPQLVKDVLAIWRDVARRDGYHFSAYYNIGRDGEIMQRRPEWNRMFPDGSPVDKALCYHSGVAEDYLWPMIREIMDGYHPEGFWFDGSCFTIRPCYCPKCTERFRQEHGMAAPEKPADRGWAAYQEMQRQIYREFIAGDVPRDPRDRSRLPRVVQLGLFDPHAREARGGPSPISPAISATGSRVSRPRPIGTTRPACPSI